MSIDNIRDDIARDEIKKLKRQMLRSSDKINRMLSPGVAKFTDQETAISHTAPTTADYALQDLVDSGVGSAFGFATKDEGNTVLQVIANMQTRLLEVETKLIAIGALEE